MTLDFNPILAVVMTRRPSIKQDETKKRTDGRTDIATMLVGEWLTRSLTNDIEGLTAAAVGLCVCVKEK